MDNPMVGYWQPTTCEDMHALLWKRFGKPSRDMPGAAFAALNHTATVRGVTPEALHSCAQRRRSAISDLLDGAPGRLNARELCMASDLAPQTVDEAARILPSHRHDDALLQQVVRALALK